MTDKKRRIGLCPEECSYRNKAVSFCGYCLYRIVNEEEEDKDADRKTETKHTEQTY